MLLTDHQLEHKNCFVRAAHLSRTKLSAEQLTPEGVFIGDMKCTFYTKSSNIYKVLLVLKSEIGKINK